MSNQKTVADAAREGFYGKMPLPGQQIDVSVQTAEKAFQLHFPLTTWSGDMNEREAMQRGFVAGYLFAKSG